MIGRCALSILRKSTALPVSARSVGGNVAWLSQRKDTQQRGSTLSPGSNDGKMEFKESKLGQGV